MIRRSGKRLQPRNQLGTECDVRCLFGGARASRYACHGRADRQLAARYNSGHGEVNQAEFLTGRRNGARGRTRGLRLAGTALPDQELDSSTVDNTSKLDVRSLGETRGDVRPAGPTVGASLRALRD